MKQPSTLRQIIAGLEMADVLRLKKERGTDRFILTTGTKTPLGVFRTLRRMVVEGCIEAGYSPDVTLRELSKEP